MKKSVNHKKLYKLLCMMLCLCLAMSWMSVTAFAAGSTDSGSCGDGVTWTFDEDSGTLIISGNGAMDDFARDDYGTKTKAPWDSYTGSIKTVVIEKGVTTIGDYAFYECTSLTSVTIADSVKYIWNQAFYGCTSLKSVTIPNSVSQIGADAFSMCSGLESVTIPNSVTIIGVGAFLRCDSLTEVVIPSSVRELHTGAFRGCAGLTSVTIPASVESIYPYVFEGCTNLTTVTYEGTTPLTGLEVFGGCKLTSVNVPASYTDDYFCCKPVKKNADISVGDITTITYGKNDFNVCENHNLTSDGICDICGAYISHIHSIDSNTGKCTTCNTKPGKAQLRDAHGRNVAEYNSIAEAMVAAKAEVNGQVHALSGSDENFTIEPGISFYGGAYEFSGNITNYGMIRGGSFSGSVTNIMDSNGNRGGINDGSFYGTVKIGKTVALRAVTSMMKS